MALVFDNESFNKSVERIRVLMDDYKVAKSDLNYYTKELNELYKGDGSPDLKELYDVEDKQFSKCIDAVCIYQDIVSIFSRLEENEFTTFTLRRLEKEIEALPPIEAHFYFDLYDDE